MEDELSVNGLVDEFMPVGDWYVDSNGDIIWFSEEEIF